MIGNNSFKSRCCLFLTLSLGFYFNQPMWAAGLTSKEHNLKCWTIDQVSEAAGEVRTQLSSQGMRMTISKLGFIVISRAPDWNVQVYNESTKNYLDVPYTELKKRLIIGKQKIDVNSIRNFVPIKTAKTRRIQGLPAWQCQIERKSDGKKRDKVFDLWVARDIQAPPPVQIIFNDLMHIPVSALIPLRAFGPDKRNGSNMVKILDTCKISQEMIQPSVFKPLTGYKRVKDEIALMMDESDLEMARGLFGDVESSPSVIKHAPGTK